MKVTVFTSNQARHLAYIKSLATISDVVYAVVESTTLFPGKVKDFFDQSPVMQAYFSRVLEAESAVFGDPGFTPQNVRVLPMKMGDLSSCPRPQLQEALDSDVFLVFGSSFIKGWLVEALVQKGAVNIHMGLSPYYRGSSCNFWALFDGKPAHVGATIHLLSKGLDSGEMLFHVTPEFIGQTPFEFSMSAVKEAQDAVVTHLQRGTLFSFAPLAQDSSLEIRYSKNLEFNDAVAEEYLGRNITGEVLGQQLSASKFPDLISPNL